ncbi:hypothetical protein HYV21_00105 [Candidatus Microgenomates bacterium]|nr:hypothetical protein [Candidatus Microgenomates bacterium]
MAREQEGYYTPDPESESQREATIAVYQKLPPTEKVMIDELVRRIEEKRIRRFGIRSAIEFIGALGIFLVRQEENTVKRP